MAMQSLDSFLSHFDAEDMREKFAPKWETAQAENPPSEYAAAFLAPDMVEAHWRMAPLRPDSLGQALAMADRVLADEWLLALAAFMHWRLFMDRDPQGPGSWPEPKPLEGDEPGCFNFLVALGFPPEYAKAQRALGIPEDVISETSMQVACFADNFHRATGKAGVFPGQLNWLHVYSPPGRYYRLGRLEFQATTNSQPFKIYRRKADGRFCALCLPGQKYRGDGEACHTDSEPPADAWSPTFEERADGISGNPVGPDGRASREAVFLPSDEWECVLTPGDDVLFMHIPEGGGMAPDLVRDSLQRALPFFDAHFPDKRAKAIICGSWILSNQLSQCLPPESNILALQRMVHLLPLSAPRFAGLWFLFLVNPPYDAATLPRDTSMRRAVADWLAAGNVFHAGCMYLMREEAARLARR